MTKPKVKVDINSEIFTNGMDSIYAGQTPTNVVVQNQPEQTNTEYMAEDTPEVKKTTTKKAGRPKNTKKDINKVNGTTKKDNYTITLKIDKTITGYLKQINWINYFKGKTDNLTLNAYVNELIKQDMIKTLGLPKGISDEKLYQEWQIFKKANKLD